MTIRNVNQTVDSLDLRILRFAGPSSWFAAEFPRWREYHQRCQIGDEPYLVDVPRLGSFTLHPVKDRPYEFVLRNPELGNIRIWNPDSWQQAINGQVGQLYLQLRSKFLQFEGLDGAERFVKACCRAFFLPFRSMAHMGWARISRADLACDQQLDRGQEWEDIGRYVSRARIKDVFAADASVSRAYELLGIPLSSSPPTGNRGGSTYTKNLSHEEIQELKGILDGLQPHTDGDNQLSRVVARSTPQTLYFGKFGGALYARRYDKLASLNRQGKAYMRQVWESNGWDGESPVWRTEFSLSGDALKCLNWIDDEGEVLRDCRDLKAFRRNISRIWSYLTHSWLRYTLPENGDRNRWRWPLAPEWVELQQAFAAEDDMACRVPWPKNPDDSQLRAQLRGVALSLAALNAKSDEPDEECTSWLGELVQWVDSPSFAPDLEERRRALGVDELSDTELSARFRREMLLEGLGS